MARRVGLFRCGAVRCGAVALSVAAAACVSPEAAPTTCAGVEIARPLVVLESDLRTTSGLGAIREDGCLTEVAGGLALGADTVLAASAGRVFVLDRESAVVHEIDPAELRFLRSVLAYGGGEERSNPQDVAVDDLGRLWVTRFDRTTVAIIGAGADAGWQTVDLAAFADADGLPEMAAIHVAGGRVWIALQKLDATSEDAVYPPAGPGTVVSIAVDDFDDVSSLDLAGQNPFGRFAEAPWDASLLAVATPGSFEALSPSDGVELLDLAAGTSRVVVTEEALGGSATSIALAAPDEAYAIAAGPEPGVNPTRVVAFDPTTGAVLRTLAEASGYYHWGLAVAGDHVVVGDRTPGSARLVLYERESGAVAGEIAVQTMAPVGIVAAPE